MDWEEIDCKFFYEGGDLGAVYTAESTCFCLWAPLAEAVKIRFYREGNGDCLLEEAVLKQDKNAGVWRYEKAGDCHGLYYTYVVTHSGKPLETIDPYAKAAGVNGERGMVVDFARTNPEGFDKDHGPELKQPTDAIIYEISVADTTADVSAGVSHPGKYLGLTEEGTTNGQGESTALDYIAKLGVTHVQIMPVYDFGSINEAESDEEQYNWGYDPENYNVPEGSYSTDPYHGEIRIREFKQMVQAFHKRGIGVIMDVVYNHTHNIEHNCFQKCVPDYYYRRQKGRYTDGSGCGNEVASDHAMVRKFIVESVLYWMREYHIDGFRFDLMAVLDMETMQAVEKAVHDVNPQILIYGEGWTGGESALPEDRRSTKANIAKLKGVGAFSDDIRDGIRGHVFYEKELGYVNGAPKKENDIRFSVVGACRHPQVDYKAYQYTASGAWAKTPASVINYASCHDNLTLWDKLSLTAGSRPEDVRKSMNRLAASIVLTSQGIPFFLSGEEFLRSKPIEGTDEFAENSYNLPLFTNSLKYGRMSGEQDIVCYYQGLIAFRKAHPSLRMTSAKQVSQNLKFLDGMPSGIVAYTVLEKETDSILLIVYNAAESAVQIPIPDAGIWEVFIRKDMAKATPLESIHAKEGQKIRIPAISCLAAVCRK